MAKVEFSYICSKTFDELEGEDHLKRFCHDCQLDVFNLDPLTEDERRVLSAAAARDGLELCVSVTTRAEVVGRSCLHSQQSVTKPQEFIAVLGRQSVSDEPMSEEEARQRAEQFRKEYQRFFEES